ncbi:RAD50-interacting protein 1 isoform X2 [Anabrus simplex]|uniref:RAD50-interacting protein 1 isoform X2 n=1 Tax=Anabrus simplex TaxID=316456 RepID=UPI0035A30BC6
MDELKKRVYQKLNEEFGDDVKNISKCHELSKKLQEEKTSIEKSLSLASSEVPSKVSAAIRGVEEASRDINSLTSRFDALSCNVRSQLEKVEGVNNKMQEYIEKIEYLERTEAYLRCVKTIEDLSEFEEVLKAIKWPVISGNSVLTTPTPESLQKFDLLTEHLLHIQLPEDLVVHPVVTSTLLVDFAPLTLPMVLLLRPLRKRFLFHFHGNKQTNRPDKPEWFFTQVLTWIRDHEKFVGQRVQPVFNRVGMQHVSAKIEMMRGLVQLVAEKLHEDLPHLQYDDALFSHTVDETLGFDRELRESFSYPSSQPNVISILTQAQVFIKWINMEKKYATEKMDAMLSSETAWLPLGTPELDELRVTECGESFLSLLLTITERYSSLPQPGHRLQFLDLQLELLDDFRVRMLQLLHEEFPDPLNSRLPAILNTISYLASVLQEWGGLTHFLQLYYYKLQNDRTGSHTEDNITVSSLPQLDDIQETVFDDILALLLHTKTELVAQLCEAVMLEVKARSREYRKDKWFAMTSPKELVNPSVTPSACSMFQVLAEKLHQLQELLSVPLFLLAWQTLAKDLCQFIYEEVILQNNFNEGGSMQLQYDMTRNLFPLFGQYTQKPDAYFAQVKEACLLLNLPKGSALLLRETLKLSLDEEGAEEGPQGSEVLADVGVHNLAPDQVIDILNLRTDLIIV